MGIPSVVVVGGGFAGFSAARTLQRLLPAAAADLTLVSATDHLCHSPLLPEVAAGRLDPRRIAVPLHAGLHRTRIVQATVEAVDVDDRSIDPLRRSPVDVKLEVVILPVADVDRAKDFYQGLGWREDADIVAGEDFRIVQLTPPGSACSISFGVGVTTMAPGSQQGLLLVTEDIEATRAEFVARGAPVSEVFHGAAGRFHPDDPSARLQGRDPGGQSYQSHAVFSDPDGNGWVLQEITQRLPGR